MKKIAFLHPGQGSQKVGMGKDIVDKYPAGKDIFNQANRILNFDVQKLCTEGPPEELNRTLYLQPTLLTINWILTCFIREKTNLRPQAVAGHSLGEYSSILTAGAVDFPTTLRIVKHRAYLMQQAGEKMQGAMAAVIGFSTEKTVDVCKSIGAVQVVNFNCPGQIVISGKRGKVLEAKKELEAQGAKKVVMLPVSGAFHSFLMEEAAKSFSLFLDKFSFTHPSFPVISNATGEYATSGAKIKKNLKLQMNHPVLWEKSMRLLIKGGFNTVVEVGPGKVLRGLMKRINRNVVALGTESIQVDK